ncbi:helix-turn-helix domain-containing protein [Salinicoccus roseus]|uniref:helix-turn-helix domain-containing protein n=1 Tax=Salinicoccus roseus TaxID=45670 RepID=UPI001EF487DD|nr:helix-turn-helix transcriptional regulator [Salinicoccus roseus]MCG7333571.1 helix-turn-helix domain-containing protein [Salinicoccus roseus]
MNFGNKLKSERMKKKWSQDDLAEKIYVSRQSISKWETGKNYPSIEVIINLSDLFDLSIDELLRSDDTLEEKIINDSKRPINLSFKTQVLSILGIVFGIIVASAIKNDGIEWLSIVETIIFTLAFLYLITLLFPKWKETSEPKY